MSHLAMHNLARNWSSSQFAGANGQSGQMRLMVFFCKKVWTNASISGISFDTSKVIVCFIDVHHLFCLFFSGRVAIMMHHGRGKPSLFVPFGLMCWTKVISAQGRSKMWPVISSLPSLGTKIFGSSGGRNNRHKFSGKKASSDPKILFTPAGLVMLFGRGRANLPALLVLQKPLANAINLVSTVELAHGKFLILITVNESGWGANWGGGSR